MALVDTTWYTNSVGYTAVTAWATGATIAAGTLRRQNTTPAVGNERVFICIVAGTTHATTEPTWVLTRGAKTTDNTVTWQECTGQAALNGDLTSTATWAQVKAATPAVLGQIIKRSNGASYQICTAAGAMSASEPTFSDTAGVTTTDTSAVWTSLGLVGNFTGGQAPHARLTNACATNWFAAGSTVYVGANHAETSTASILPSPAGSLSTVGKIICHNQSGSYPPAAGDITTGATISTTAAVSITLTAAGGLYVYGLALRAGVGMSSSANINLPLGGAWLVMDTCSFDLASSATANSLSIGSGSYGTAAFDNCTVKFGHASNKIILTTGQVTWQNTSPLLASGSAVPTLLLSITGTSTVVFEALDLGTISGSLCSSGVNVTSLLIKDCKVHASATVDTPTAPTSTLQLDRSDSGATSYKSSRYAYEATETTETSIVRTGGAVDPTGQAQSRKIATTANAQWLRPFKAEPYAIWNATTGANVTVTVYGTINSASLPLNDEIFMEVEYLASSHPGIVVTTTKATLLSTGTAVASDNSTWNGGGSGAGWSPFKLTVTVSPGMAGVIEARIRAAKASTTYYIDPQPVLT